MVSPTSTLPSTHPKTDGIPLPVKISLPAVVVVLALFITCLVIKRHPGCFRACKRKKKEDADMEMMGLPRNHRVRMTPYAMRLLPPPPPPSTVNRASNTGIGYMHNQQPKLHNLHTVERINEMENGTNYIPRYPSCPCTSALLDCDYSLENQMYARSGIARDVPCSCNCNGASPVESRTCSPRPPVNMTLPAKGKSGCCEPFVPASKGYITMSSGNLPPKKKCGPRNGYITARPAQCRRKPVNVCLPMTRSEENISDNNLYDPETPSTCDEDRSHNPTPGPDDPLYERLDRYFRPSVRTKRTTSCPSSKYRRKQTPVSRQRAHYDSLPLLSLQMSTVEIPIGPFISKDRKEEQLSETVEKIQNSASFENMFEGAWWHVESEHDLDKLSDDVPDLPQKQMRNKTSSLPPVFRQSGHRPTSAPYVTMNKGSRPVVRREYFGACSSAHIGQHSSERPKDSYMSHGQMMKMLQFYGVGDIGGDTENNIPPPIPCVLNHDYVNARRTREKNFS